MILALLSAFGLMLERWIIISGVAFSPFLHFVFVALIYNVTIQLHINDINFIIIIMLLPFAITYYVVHNYLDIL